MQEKISNLLQQQCEPQFRVDELTDQQKVLQHQVLELQEQQQRHIKETSSQLQKLLQEMEMILSQTSKIF
jgi:hypothetical protein